MSNILDREKIELSSTEVTAYWWVNVIKSKVRELVISGAYDQQEVEFVKMFYNYTDVEWRALYIALNEFITEDINNFVPRGNIMGIDAFSQDTDEKRHDRLNEELAKIVGHRIPDIRLADRGSKDSVIYTNMFGASVWYKSCGVNNLPTEYDPCYILTGDEKELDYYNLLISTLATLDRKDGSFHSVPLVREVFCQKDKTENEEDINEPVKRFNYFFKKANENGVVLGRFWEDTYFASFRDIDFVGLEKYMDTAEDYATAILQKNRGENGTPYSKKLENNN